MAQITMTHDVIFWWYDYLNTENKCITKYTAVISRKCLIIHEHNYHEHVYMY